MDLKFLEQLRKLIEDFVAKMVERALDNEGVNSRLNIN